MKENRFNELIQKTRDFLSWAVRFVTYDIWRITENEVSGMRIFYFDLIKTIILAGRGFTNQNLSRKAAALTYNTLLSIVPLLAVLLGIAKGFGFQNNVRDQLMTSFPGHDEELTKAFGFVESYLAEAQGGVFIGIGLILLLYTVIMLISSIEDSFNEIWQVKKARSWYRKLSDYLAICIILPILLIASSGISIFVSTIQNFVVGQFQFFSPMTNIMLKTLPFITASLAFAGLYIALPNTKVKFMNGLIAGVLAGCAFQIFQYIYISGQIWVSRYNAIYGSFAALPLLLLWLQLSWLICLFGAELAYASQNVKKFDFERDTKNISRRYKDFLTLLIATLIVKRFVKAGHPYTADELSSQNCIPIRLTTSILYLLQETGIIIEVTWGDDERVIHYQPAVDVNRLSVSLLLTRLDRFGSEHFKVDRKVRFAPEWNALMKARNDFYQANQDVLLKDI